MCRLALSSLCFPFFHSGLLFNIITANKLPKKCALKKRKSNYFDPHNHWRYGTRKRIDLCYGQHERFPAPRKPETGKLGGEKIASP